MKLIDMSAAIGYGTVNKSIVNHENYPVYEKVKQAKNSAELLAEMDFCGIDEAVTWHQTMYDVSVNYGNRLYLSDPGNHTGRLKGTIGLLPAISDADFEISKLDRTVDEYGLVGVRAFPRQNRFFLDEITMGDTLNYLAEKNLPLYLSPRDGWEDIFSVMKHFPRLTVILTDYGLWGSDRYVFPLIRAYENFYIESSDYQVFLGVENFVNKMGSDQMLFGTNYPNCNMGGSTATLLAAKISETDREKIAHTNAERLFGRIQRGMSV